jgi:predicted transcriptional regulator
LQQDAAGGTMAKTMISARVDVALNKKLEDLAEASQRSKAFLITEALEALVAREEWFEERVAQAVKVANDTEHWISHEAMGQWIDSLGADSSTQAPKPDVHRPRLKTSA